jgi:hypothetical protein
MIQSLLYHEPTKKASNFFRLCRSWYWVVLKLSAAAAQPPKILLAFRGKTLYNRKTAQKPNE